MELKPPFKLANNEEAMRRLKLETGKDAKFRFDPRRYTGNSDHRQHD